MLPAARLARCIYAVSQVCQESRPMDASDEQRAQSEPTYRLLLNGDDGGVAMLPAARPACSTSTVGVGVTSTPCCLQSETSRPAR